MRDTNILSTPANSCCSAPAAQSQESQIPGHFWSRWAAGIRSTLRHALESTDHPSDDPPRPSGPFRMHDVPWIAIR